MTAELHPAIWSFLLNPPAPTGLMEKVQAELGIVFPQDYAKFMEQHNGGEGWVRKRYLILYPLEQLVPLNRVGGISEFLPGLTLFGSDGGGMDYLFDIRNGEVQIATSPDIGASPSTVRSCALNLQGLLAHLAASEDE